MDPHELQSLLDRLIAEWENEVVEFKAVGDSYSTSDIGKYVSALSNEANLLLRAVCPSLGMGITLLGQGRA